MSWTFSENNKILNYSIHSMESFAHKSLLNDWIRKSMELTPAYLSTIIRLAPLSHNYEFTFYQKMGPGPGQENSCVTLESVFSRPIWVLSRQVAPEWWEHQPNRFYTETELNRLNENPEHRNFFDRDPKEKVIESEIWSYCQFAVLSQVNWLKFLVF